MTDSLLRPLNFATGPSNVGQDGILRAIGNRADLFVCNTPGRLTIGRRMPSCPTVAGLRRIQVDIELPATLHMPDIAVTRAHNADQKHSTDKAANMREVGGSTFGNLRLRNGTVATE